MTEIAPQAHDESYAQTDSLNQQTYLVNDPRNAQDWGGQLIISNEMIEEGAKAAYAEVMQDEENWPDVSGSVGAYTYRKAAFACFCAMINVITDKTKNESETCKNICQKLLIADTQDRAEFFINELGLNKNVWKGICVGGALSGYKFCKFVDLTTNRKMSLALAKMQQEWFNDLRCHLDNSEFRKKNKNRGVK